MMTDQPSKDNTPPGGEDMNEKSQLGEVDADNISNESALDELRRHLVEEGYIPRTPPVVSDSESGEYTNHRTSSNPGSTLLNKPAEEPSSMPGSISEPDNTQPGDHINPINTTNTSCSPDENSTTVGYHSDRPHSTSNSLQLSPKHSLSRSGTMNGEVILDKPPEVTTVGDKESGGCCSLNHEKLFTIITFCISNFCVGAFYSLLGPFFPQEAAKKGVSSTITGVIFGVFELMIILTSPVAGYQISRVGAKFMYVTGVMVCGTCAILFGFLDASPDGTLYIVMCFLVRMLEGMGAGAFITASFAIIAFTFPDSVGATFGSLEFFSGLGLMVGPPVGGALYQLGGFRLPFVSGGSLVVCIGLASIFLLPNPRDAPKPSGNKLAFLCTPVVLVVLLLLLMASAAIGFLDVSLSIHLQEVYHFTPVITGLVFLVAPGAYGFSAPMWGYLADKKPQLSEYIIVFGMFIGGVGFLVMGPAPFIPIPNNLLWLLIISLAFMGVGIGSTVISFQLMTYAARDMGYPDNLDTYGMVSGLFSSFFSTGAFVGPIIAGALNDAMGFGYSSMVFGFAVVASGIVVALYTIVKVSRKSRQLPVEREDEETTRLLQNSGSTTRRSYTEA